MSNHTDRHNQMRPIRAEGTTDHGNRWLWREARGNHPLTFTMLTTAPGPDVAPLPSRQVVVVRPEDWSAWLH